MVPLGNSLRRFFAGCARCGRNEPLDSPTPEDRKCSGIIRLNLRVLESILPWRRLRAASGHCKRAESCYPAGRKARAGAFVRRT
jgi:hypothetical protein